MRTERLTAIVLVNPAIANLMDLIRGLLQVNGVWFHYSQKASVTAERLKAAHPDEVAIDPLLLCYIQGEMPLIRVFYEGEETLQKACAKINKQFELVIPLIQVGQHAFQPKALQIIPAEHVAAFGL